jgi:uncharacterized protein YukJ
MPLANYGVLKGKAIGAKREDDQSTPHYQVHILADAGHNRIAVNSKSQSSPSELLFLVNDNFQHPLTARLPALAEGFTPLPRTANGGGLDYIRANLFNRLDMRPLPSSLPGADNDLISWSISSSGLFKSRMPRSTPSASAGAPSRRRGTKSSTSCPDSAFMTST